MRRRTAAALAAAVLLAALPRAAGAEMFVGTALGGGVLVFPDDADGETEPLRRVSAPGEFGFTVLAVAVDPVNEELLVLRAASEDENRDPVDTGVLVWDLDATGVVEPERVIAGPRTGIPVGGAPNGLAVDPLNDEIYVAERATSTILVYDRLADGDVAPIRTLVGEATGIFRPQTVFVDPTADELYVLQPPFDLGFAALLVFGRTDAGDVEPRRAVAIDAFMSTKGLFVDVEARLAYIADAGSDAVHVISSLANGVLLEPLRTLRGDLTTLIATRPQAVVVTEDDEMLVPRFAGGSVTVFPSDAEGDVEPLRDIRTPITSPPIALPAGIASTAARGGSAGSVWLPEPGAGAATATAGLALAALRAFGSARARR